MHAMDRTPALVSQGGRRCGRRLPARNAGVTRNFLINRRSAGPTRRSLPIRANDVQSNPPAIRSQLT